MHFQKVTVGDGPNPVERPFAATGLEYEPNASVKESAPQPPPLMVNRPAHISAHAKVHTSML